VRIAYDGRRCEHDVAKRVLGHFRTVLDQIAGNPALRLMDIQVLTGNERDLMLNDWNDTAEDFGDKTCVAGLIEAQAERIPDTVAVRIDEKAITYRDLNVRANRLAHFLRSVGVAPESIVGICLEPSIEVVVATLAVLKAGGAYLPLDPGFPPDRLRYMVGDAQASYLLTQGSLAPLFEESPARQIVLDGRDDFQSWSELNPINPCSLQNLAYVIFTSGSTGKPKGSLIVHEGLYNLVKASVRDHEITPGSRVLNFFSFGFDGSVLTIFPALAGGATLHLARREELMSPSDVHRLLREKGITTILMTPSALAHIPSRDLPDLTTVICGGEVCPREVGMEWGKGRRFVNDYGPTETTVAAAQFPFHGTSDGPGSLPIGRPLANCRLFVLDRHLRPVPIGVAGELFIAGEGVGRGYLGRPGLTAECFLPDPFGSEPGGRMYRTGDLVRFLSDGNLEFLGRIDDQVKIRGFRIELGEIEAVLASVPGVREALTTVREDVPGDKRIVGYLVPQSGVALSQEELGAHLKVQLPSYMIPSDFVTVDAFPLTPTGKVDRKALPAPGTARRVAEGVHLEPRDDTEKRLVTIWEEVLQKRPIGVTDNFFDLGGHSFLAVRLLAQIQSQFGKEVPMVALFQDPTVEHLARMLRDKDEVSTGATLVQLRKGGSQPPLFFVHPTGGSVHWYSSLTKHLDGERPVFGLQAKGLGGQEDLDTTIEAMASGYVHAITDKHPAGPYNIAGWSLGVVIAFEVARQLRMMEREVSLLAILDQGPEVPIREEPSDDAELLFNIFSSYFPVDLEYLRTLDNDEQFRFMLKRAQRAGIVPPFVRRKNFRHYIMINKVQTQAWRAYVAKPYPGRISLFRSEELVSRSGSQPDLGWAKLAQGGMDLVDVPGDHMSMMEMPHVRYLAEKLDALIQPAQVVDAERE
jgi:amino acid adenylation domain-containing protein